MIHKAFQSMKRFYSVVVATLLLSIIFFSACAMFHSQLIPLGSSLFENYVFLRSELRAPNCDVALDIEQEIQKHIVISKAEDSELSGLFAPEPIDQQAIRRSIEKQIAVCQEKKEIYESNSANLTPLVEAYRDFEHSIGSVSEVGAKVRKITVILLLLLCSLATTFKNSQISLRPILSTGDHRLSHSIQLLANLLIFLSINSHREILSHSISDDMTQNLLLLSQFGFASLAFINIYRLICPPSSLSKHSIDLTSFLTVPLISIMTLIGAYYFHFVEGHFAGISIYFKQLPDNSTIFINIALYIWVGMMIKQTHLGRLLFNCIKPWHLAPTVLAGFIVFLMGLPTAYTGASGIIVIALGGLIYQEMRSANTPRPLALATVAMSGSLGVVLSPCLLVALIAALNREVTTDQLYGWGIWIFLLTSFLFTLAAYNFGGKFTSIPREPFALMKTFSHIKLLIPYVLISVSIIAGFEFLLNAPLNKDNAPVIAPTLILAFLLYEHRPSGPDATVRLADTLGTATRETVIHIGGLLMLMGVSLIIGGTIERSELINLLPEALGGEWITMLLLCTALVILGMVMDPFGAVILVTGTIAAVAYSNGIHPVHFWVTALVAFELGYLTPPVALNQLLARHVIGEVEALEAANEAKNYSSWWQRNLQFGLPMLVMLLALILVAFVPLYFYDYKHSVYQLSE